MRALTRAILRSCKADSEAKSGADATASAAADAKANGGAQADDEAVADAGTQADAGAQDAEAHWTPFGISLSFVATVADAGAEANTAAAEADAATQANTKAEAKANANALANAKAEAEVDANALVDADAEAGAEAGAEARAEAGCLAGADVGSKAEPEVEAKLDALHQQVHTSRINLLKYLKSINFDTSPHDDVDFAATRRMCRSERAGIMNLVLHKHDREQRGGHDAADDAVTDPSARIFVHYQMQLSSAAKSSVFKAATLYDVVNLYKIERDMQVNDSIVLVIGDNVDEPTLKLLEQLWDKDRVYVNILSLAQGRLYPKHVGLSNAAELKVYQQYHIENDEEPPQISCEAEVKDKAQGEVEPDKADPARPRRQRPRPRRHSVEAAKAEAGMAAKAEAEAEAAATVKQTTLAAEEQEFASVEVCGSGACLYSGVAVGGSVASAASTPAV